MELKIVTCPECGDRLESNLEFCTHCGALIAEDDSLPVETRPEGEKIPCPVCKKKNDVRDTFQCPACDAADMCRDHRVKNSKHDFETGDFITEYYCVKCWKKTRFTMFSE